METIIDLIKRDPIRVTALNCVWQLKLPQCYIAAGFVRNLVWDALHQVEVATPLNDVDVIYFDPDEVSPKAFLQYEAQLRQCLPQLNWQVRNQAIMHTRNGDVPYQSAIDAMRYWPEKETAVAVRQVDDSEYECVAAFGVQSLLNYCVTHNPKRSRDIFEHRVNAKQWLSKWPRLRVVL